MKPYINLIIFNQDGTERWNLTIEKEESGLYKVQDTTKYSLFNSNHWEAGKTPGEALDNFMKVETELIEGL